MFNVIDGKEYWTYQATEEITTIAITNNNNNNGVYAVTTDGSIFALDSI